MHIADPHFDSELQKIPAFVNLADFIFIEFEN